MILEVDITTRHQGDFVLIGETELELGLIRGLRSGKCRIERHPNGTIVVLKTAAEPVAYCDELTATADAPKYNPVAD